MHLITRKIPIAQLDNKAIGKRDIRNSELLTERPEPAIFKSRKMLRGSRAYDSPTNHDFPDSYSATDGAKFIMTEKPTAKDGRSYFLKESGKLGALKLRAENLGLAPYAGLYGDRRCSATWQKLLENEPDLEPLQPRQPEKSSNIDWKLAIALFVGAMALFCLLKPLYSKVLPIQITIQLGRK